MQNMGGHSRYVQKVQNAVQRDANKTSFGKEENSTGMQALTILDGASVRIHSLACRLSGYRVRADAANSLPQALWCQRQLHSTPA